MRRSFNAFLVLSFFVVSLAFAQVPRIPFGGGFSGGSDGIKGEATFHLTTIQLTANAPYSGEEKTESVQTLADGTHVTQAFRGRTQKAWRDSQGRVRMEQPLGGGMGNARYKLPTLVQIEDPSTGYIYIMDDINKVAHRVKAQVVPQGKPLMGRMAPVEGGGGGGGGRVGAGVMGYPGDAGAVANARPRPQTSAPEDLGMQTIDGLSAHGSRTTTVIPTGAQGNDGPITITSDTWYSPELNMVIRTVSNDPRSGTQTMSIANLSRNEPDPSLFMAPADYTTVDENGTFTIKWDTTSSGKQ